MKRPRQPGAQGFTLIELLVVIAIIGVLAGVLAPALHGAKDRARFSKCMSNQRQIGFTFHMYADDHSDYCPRHSGYANYGGQAGTNTAKASGGSTPASERPMTRYLFSADVFHCPADRGRILGNGPDVRSCWEELGNSYQTLWRWTGTKDSPNQVSGDSTVAWDDPSGYGRPGKMSDFLVSPQNKVLQGDAEWWMMDLEKHKQRVWHPPNNKRDDILMPGQWPTPGRRDDFMLFADCHTDFVIVPRGPVLASLSFWSEWW